MGQDSATVLCLESIENRRLIWAWLVCLIDPHVLKYLHAPGAHSLAPPLQSSFLEGKRRWGRQRQRFVWTDYTYCYVYKWTISQAINTTSLDKLGLGEGLGHVHTVCLLIQGIVNQKAYRPNEFQVEISFMYENVPASCHLSWPVLWGAASTRKGKTRSLNTEGQTKHDSKRNGTRVCLSFYNSSHGGSNQEDGT